eukprot:2018639-Pyramimonas_sp.AAC.1
MGHITAPLFVGAAARGRLHLFPERTPPPHPPDRAVLARDGGPIESGLSSPGVSVMYNNTGT